MNVIQTSLLSIYDGYPLHLTIMVPNDKAKGIVQVAHGMCEYRERYDAFLRYLCKDGYICVIHDHRGHGKNLNTDDLGHFHDDSGEYIVEDFHEITKYMKHEYPNLPIYLFGHSMGSLVVRCYIKKYDYEVSGLIVCGSPSKNPMAKVGRFLVSCMTKIKGDQYRSEFIHKMAFSSYAKKFNEESKNSWICSQKDVVSAYDQDAYCNYRFTLNGFYNLFTLLINTYDEDRWITRNKALPIFFIAGSDDPCIGNEEKFYHAAHFMRRVGYESVKSKLYKGKRHEILNEDIKEEVYRDVCDFLNHISMNGE